MLSISERIYRAFPVLSTYDPLLLYALYEIWQHISGLYTYLIIRFPIMLFFLHLPKFILEVVFSGPVLIGLALCIGTNVLEKLVDHRGYYHSQSNRAQKRHPACNFFVTGTSIKVLVLRKSHPGQKHFVISHSYRSSPICHHVMACSGSRASSPASGISSRHSPKISTPSVPCRWNDPSSPQSPHR